MYPKLASSLFEEIQYFMPLLSSHHYLPFGRNTFMDAKTTAFQKINQIWKRNAERRLKRFRK